MKYLNEEKYQKTNKGIKIVGLIIMLVGITLLGVGIFKIVKADDMFKTSGAMFIIIPGIFFTILGCMICFLLGNRRQIMAYQMQEMMPLMHESMEQMRPMMKENLEYMTPVMQEHMQQMAPTYGEVAKEVAKGVKEGLEE